MGLAKHYEQRVSTPVATPTPPEPTSETDRALQLLRERYARGDIDEEAFEARLGLLLETESLGDVDRLLASRARRERQYQKERA